MAQFEITVEEIKDTSLMASYAGLLQNFINAKDEELIVAKKVIKEMILKIREENK